MNRKGGPQRKTRGKLRKKSNQKGKISIKKIFQVFKIGEKVQLVVDSSDQKGRFPLRFHGKRGTITKKQGKAYQVTIKDQNKEKSFIVKPIHIKKIGGK